MARAFDPGAFLDLRKGGATSYSSLPIYLSACLFMWVLSEGKGNDDWHGQQFWGWTGQGLSNYLKEERQHTCQVHCIVRCLVRKLRRKSLGAEDFGNTFRVSG